MIAVNDALGSRPNGQLSPTWQRALGLDRADVRDPADLLGDVRLAAPARAELDEVHRREHQPAADAAAAGRAARRRTHREAARPTPAPSS